MTDLDLDAEQVTRQIGRIVGLLEGDNAPHLFDDLPWFVHRHLSIIASEIRPNQNAREDNCMDALRQYPDNKAAQCTLIQWWIDSDCIDINQAAFMASMCGLDPRKREQR